MNSDTALRTQYTSGSSVTELLKDPDILAVFEFGHSPLDSTDPRHVPVALPEIDQASQLEVWRCDGPIKTGSWDCLRFAQGEQLTMGHIALDWKEAGGMRHSSARAYEILQTYLQQSPHPWPLKIWNYIPDINLGEGDDELYRQFCLGRADAVMTDPGDLPPLPAATAIGTPGAEPALQIYFLSGALPGMDVENPRQVSAWRYPRQYGPRSPLFSRGTILKLGGTPQFLLSGTASVVGHETHHEHEVSNQLSESLRNVNSLFDEGWRLTGDSLARLDQDGLLKVYVRDPGDLEQISRTIDSEVPPDVPRIYLQGDICRENLLIEIDGIFCCREA